MRFQGKGKKGVFSFEQKNLVGKISFLEKKNINSFEIRKFSNIKML